MTTVVFVHGNPETDIIWDPLAEGLAQAGRTDQVRLSPPGFGSPVPAGFAATPAGYRDWLASELEQIGAPVDLVGHDWGGGHVVNLAMSRPELLRSWASDAIGAFHPDYVWHDVAQIWQTAGEGERWISGRLAARPEELAQMLSSHGMEPVIAGRLAASFDAAMGACILALYRAARQPAMAELGTRLPAAAARPGLALVATADGMVGSIAQRRDAAAMAGARVAALEGAGHWWMTEPDPSAAVSALTRFWSGLEGGDLSEG
jgi:pimeloyl-ACP methyl ester carboxylesterase